MAFKHIRRKYVRLTGREALTLERMVSGYKWVMRGKLTHIDKVRNENVRKIISEQLSKSKVIRFTRLMSKTVKVMPGVIEFHLTQIQLDHCLQVVNDMVYRGFYKTIQAKVLQAKIQRVALAK